jgi:hypothetical protein
MISPMSDAPSSPVLPENQFLSSGLKKKGARAEAPVNDSGGNDEAGTSTQSKSS